MVLRTRRDWFVHIRDHGLDAELADMVNEHKGVTTSTYEIAAYTGLNRNTVRRKLARLADIGLLERTADGERRTDQVTFTSWFVSRGGTDAAFAADGDGFGVERRLDPVDYEVTTMYLYDPRVDVCYRVEGP
mgnify:CR=1 FL=1